MFSWVFACCNGCQRTTPVICEYDELYDWVCGDCGYFYDASRGTAVYSTIWSPPSGLPLPLGASTVPARTIEMQRRARCSAQELYIPRNLLWYWLIAVWRELQCGWPHVWRSCSGGWGGWAQSCLWTGGGGLQDCLHHQTLSYTLTHSSCSGIVAVPQWSGHPGFLFSSVWLNVIFRC